MKHFVNPFESEDVLLRINKFKKYLYLLILSRQVKKKPEQMFFSNMSGVPFFV